MIQDLPSDPSAVPFLARMTGVLGFAVMIALAWAMSEDRRRVPWKLVGSGVALQVVVGILVLKTELGRAFFRGVNGVFVRLLSFTEEGARFLFGSLVRNNVPAGVPLGEPVDMAPLAASEVWVNTGAYVAFTVLPVIVFFSTLVSILYYLGVLQRIVRAIAWVMQRTMKTSGAETLCVAGNIFVGPTESPLLIRPFVGSLTLSELNTVMVSGFATIAGSVLAAYIGILSPFIPDIGGHLMTASIMNAPAALLVSKILFPEGDRPPVTAGELSIDVEVREVNVIEAAAVGASQGLKLAVNVGAMLLAFIALVAMINFLIGAAGSLVGIEQLSMERIFGWVFSPLAWLMGVPWADATIVGSLMGVKVAINEFVAYLQLGGVLGAAEPISDRAAVIASYALLGFANFGTIAIQIAGIGGMAPERRSDLARLGLRAMAGGNLAAFMSACVAGILV